MNRGDFSAAEGDAREDEHKWRERNPTKKRRVSPLTTTTQYQGTEVPGKSYVGIMRQKPMDFKEGSSPILESFWKLRPAAQKALQEVILEKYSDLFSSNRLQQLASKDEEALAKDLYRYGFEPDCVEQCVTELRDQVWTMPSVFGEKGEVGEIKRHFWSLNVKAKAIVRDVLCQYLSFSHDEGSSQRKSSGRIKVPECLHQHGFTFSHKPITVDHMPFVLEVFEELLKPRYKRDKSPINKTLQCDHCRDILRNEVKTPCGPAFYGKACSSCQKWTRSGEHRECSNVSDWDKTCSGCGVKADSRRELFLCGDYFIGHNISCGQEICWKAWCAACLSVTPSRHASWLCPAHEMPTVGTPRSDIDNSTDQDGHDSESSDSDCECAPATRQEGLLLMQGPGARGPDWQVQYENRELGCARRTIAYQEDEILELREENASLEAQNAAFQQEILEGKDSREAQMAAHQAIVDVCRQEYVGWQQRTAEILEKLTQEMVAATARENLLKQEIRELGEGRATLQAQIAAHELAGDASSQKCTQLMQGMVAATARENQREQEICDLRQCNASLEAQNAALQQEIREGKASQEAQMAAHQAVVDASRQEYVGWKRQTAENLEKLTQEMMAATARENQREQEICDLREGKSLLEAQNAALQQQIREGKASLEAQMAAHQAAVDASRQEYVGWKRQTAENLEKLTQEMMAATARENLLKQEIRELGEGRATLQAQIAAHELAGDASSQKCTQLMQEMVAATARENQREQVIRELEEGRATLQAQIAAHELAGDASCKKRATLQAQIAALQQEVREGKASLEAQMAEHQAVVEKKDARIAADQQMSAFSSFHHHDCLRRNLELQEMLQTSASCSKELQDELRTAKMVMKHTEARNALLESKFNGGPNGCTSGCSGEEGVTLDVS